MLNSQRFRSKSSVVCWGLSTSQNLKWKPTYLLIWFYRSCLEANSQVWCPRRACMEGPKNVGTRQLRSHLWSFSWRCSSRTCLLSSVFHRAAHFPPAPIPRICMNCSGSNRTPEWYCRASISLILLFLYWLAWSMSSASVNGDPHLLQCEGAFIFFVKRFEHLSEGSMSLRSISIYYLG